MARLSLMPGIDPADKELAMVRHLFAFFVRFLCAFREPFADFRSNFARICSFFLLIFALILLGFAQICSLAAH